MTRTYNRKKNSSRSARRRTYKEDIQRAYDVGYFKGWDDAYSIPKRVGAVTVAACGFRKGARNRRRSDAYVQARKKN